MIVLRKNIYLNVIDSHVGRMENINSCFRSLPEKEKTLTIRPNIKGKCKLPAMLLVDDICIYY